MTADEPDVTFGSMTVIIILLICQRSHINIHLCTTFKLRLEVILFA